MDKLTKLRNQIDKTDDEFVKTLAKRMEIVKRIGDYKKARGIPALDQKRWNEVLKSKMKKAKKFEIDENLIRDIYEIIHRYALEAETNNNE
jgi:chorismate mutase